MTPEGWAVNLIAIGAAVSAAYQSRGAKKAAKEGKASSEEAVEVGHLAAERSEPTSNGYAKSTREALARIERQGQRTEQLLVDHISDHARADLRRH